MSLLTSIKRDKKLSTNIKYEINSTDEQTNSNKIKKYLLINKSKFDLENKKDSTDKQID